MLRYLLARRRALGVTGDLAGPAGLCRLRHLRGPRQVGETMATGVLLFLGNDSTMTAIVAEACQLYLPPVSAVVPV